MTPATHPFVAEGLRMSEGGRGSARSSERMPAAVSDQPHWIAISATICPRCRARYLPIVGTCFCVGGHP